MDYTPNLNPPKQPLSNATAVRFDEEDKSLLSALVSHHRLKQSDIIRIAIRRMAEDDLLGRKRG